MFHYGGPWRVVNASEPRLEEREWHLARIADAYFIELPVGVGFSHQQQQTVMNDSIFAEQAGAALCGLELSEKYEIVVIAGESYGGVFVPLAVANYLQRRCKRPRRIALYIGNGCVGTEVGPCANKARGFQTLRTMADHHLVSEQTHKTVLNFCHTQNDILYSNEQCRQALIQASFEAGPRNTYNLRDTKSCRDAETLLHFLCAHHRGSNWVCDAARKEKSNSTCLLLQDAVPVQTIAFAQCLHRPDVRSVLRVPHSVVSWTPRLHSRYRRTVKDLVSPHAYPVSYRWLASVLDGILISAGLDDAQVPASATAAWVHSLNLSIYKNTSIWYRPNSSSLPGGDITIYVSSPILHKKLEDSLPSQHFLALVTVRQSGHSLLKYQPASIISLIAQLLF